MTSLENDEENIQNIPIRKLNNLDEFLYFALIYIGFNLFIYIITFLNGRISSEEKVNIK